MNAGEKKSGSSFASAEKNKSRRLRRYGSDTDSSISRGVVDGQCVGACCKELLNRLNNRRPSLRFVDGLAQPRAAGNSMSEPGSKLLHLAGCVRKFLIQQHRKIRANQVVAIQFRRLRVASAGRVFRDLAKNPRIRRRGAANHHRIAMRLGHQRACIFRRANIAVPNHRNRHRLLDGANPFPPRLAGVALFAGARMQRHSIQSARLRQPRQLHAHNAVIVPSHAKLHRERNRHRRSHPLKDARNQRQVAQQSTAAVAAHNPFRRASQVQIHNVEARIFHNARRLRQCLWIGAEQLRRDRMLVFVVGQVPLALRFAHARQAVRRCKFRHDQPAAGLLIAHAGFNASRKNPPPRFLIRLPIMEHTRVADESAEHRIRHAGHGRQHRRRRNRNRPDLQRRRNANACSGIACSAGLSQCFFIASRLL